MELSGPSPGETRELPIDETQRVYRLVKAEDVMRVGNGGSRPKSSAFSDSSSDGAMSVFLGKVVEDAGKNPLDIPSVVWPSFTGVRICYHTVQY